jgi:two-component system, LytTR family, response regulator
MTLCAVIVDDERPARRELRMLLAAYPDIKIGGEAADIGSAKEVVGRMAPDVVFLDIQMGSTSGFTLLSHLPPLCRVVFVTAFNEHAVRAFEVNALDYLLKPVHPERLAATVQRLLAPINGRAHSPRMSPDAVAFLPCGSASAFVAVRTIVCVLADGDYSRVVTDDGRERVILRSLQEWERRLPPGIFLRVHRSAIVNLAAVARATPVRGGQFRLQIPTLAAPLLVSRRFARQLRAFGR